jgi:hypothetical protein
MIASTLWFINIFWISRDCSWIVSLLLLWFSKIWVNISGESAVFESIGVWVICGERVYLVSVKFILDEILECSVLFARLALMPVLHLYIAHAAVHFLSLQAVDHPLMESIARVSGQTHWQEWLYHFCNLLLLLIIIICSKD